MGYTIGAVTYESVTIASAASLSAAVNLQGRTLIGVVMPGTWTAANLTFQDSVVDGGAGTFVDVYDPAGTEYLVTAAASRSIPIPPQDFASCSYIKVRSGTTGTPVAQGGDRILILKLAEVLS